jgi:hypothetical protein
VIAVSFGIFAAVLSPASVNGTSVNEEAGESFELSRAVPRAQPNFTGA